MMSAAVRRQSMRRQSILPDQGGASAATTAAGIPSGSRTAFIMTSAQSRRVSVSNAAPSAVSRAYENTYRTEPVSHFKERERESVCVCVCVRVCVRACARALAFCCCCCVVSFVS